MVLGFWEKLIKENKGPIICLAPMADVTDSAFRFIIAKYSKSNTSFSLSTDISLLGNSSARLSQPAQGTLERVFDFVMWTEFVSADGLILASEEGKKKLMKDLEYSEIERPIVAQLFGSRPENMRKAARLIVELGFDGLDINMGCPDKSVEKQGAGAAMIKNPKLAREIIRAAKTGIKEAAENFGKQEIPLSVKTRLGYNTDELETWLPELLEENLAAITIHARTRKEMSKVPARWERIKRAVEIRDSMQSGTPSPLQGEGAGGEVVKTLIFGNGDVLGVEDAYIKAQESGADGVMLGRAIFGNPFLFADKVPTKKEKLEALMEHIKLFEKNLGEVKSFAVIKKHFKSYLSGVASAKSGLSGFEVDKKLKEDLMNSTNPEEALIILSKMI